MVFNDFVVRVTSTTIARLLPAIVWAVALSIPGLATAADHIVGQAYFEDRDATLSFQDIRQKSFVPFAGVLSKGYSQSAFWIRLRIDPGRVVASGDPQDARQLVLRIRPTYLDEIALFDPLQPTAEPRLVGDRQPWGKGEYPSLHFNFVIPRGETPRDVWLRLKTVSTSQIYVEALSLDEARKSDRKLDLLYALYLAFLVLFLVWGLIRWSARRERVIGLFILKQAVGLAYAVFYLGFARVFLDGLVPPPWLDTLTSLLIMGYVAAAIWFDSNFLGEFGPPIWGMRLLRFLLALFPVELALVVLGKLSLALHLNMIVTTVEPFLAWALAVSGSAWRGGGNSHRPLVPRGALITLYSTILVSVSAASFPALGLAEAPAFTLYTFLGYGLISGIAMVGVLQWRSHRMEERRARALTELAIMERRIEQERQQRQEQTRFLAMLTHELKTPLAVMRLVAGSRPPSDELLAHAERAVRDMSGVLDRCMHVERLSDLQVAANLADHALDDELEELRRSSPAPERLVITTAISPLLKTDSQILRIILGNLVDNAIKYSPPGTPVQIDVVQDDRAHGDGVSIAVRNLPGAAGRPDPDKVFQKYYRSKGAHHQTGSGLGLFLAHGMARLLGGEVGYVHDDTFVRFTLWLPA